MKDLLIFIGGVAVGATASYFITKTLIEKESADKIEEAREYYKSEIEALKGVDEDETVEDTEEEERDEQSELVEHATNKPSLDEVVNYNAITKQYRKEETEEKEEDIEVLKPYTISEEEFDNAPSNYRKLYLTYYDEDDVLSDEGYDEVDVEETVGEDFFKHFGELEDPDLIYMRNDDEMEVYEISKVHSSYWQTAGAGNGDDED